MENTIISGCKINRFLCEKQLDFYDTTFSALLHLFKVVEILSSFAIHYY